MRIVFICTGNTCRSPMAEGYLNSLMLSGVTAESRGLFADGSPVSDNSAKAMSEIGIDISGHKSKQFTAEDLSADLIVCLSGSHRDALIGAGVSPERITVLGDGVSDPFGGDIHIYRICRDQIVSEIDRLVFEGFILPLKTGYAEFSQIPFIATLEQECFSTPWSVNSLEESFAAGTNFFTCTDPDGTVLGYIGISAILDEGYITNIAVSENRRRSGIGTLLLNRILSFAREKALAFVSLEVRASNTSAISLYEKFGFKAEGRRKGFYTDPTEDAIIMTKRF